MQKNVPGIKKLYYSIGEVSELTGLRQYVLRYWETEFKQLSPPKNKAGNRTYRQKDIELILQIKKLLYEDKFTIDGARKQLTAGVGSEEQEVVFEADKSINPSEIKEPAGGGLSDRNRKVLKHIRQELEAILEIIAE